MRIKVFLSSFAFFLMTSITCQVTSEKPYQLAESQEGGSDGLSNDRTMGFWVLPFSGAGSPWTRIPGNTNRYQRNHFLVRAGEIAQSGFPSGSIIDGIGFYIGEAGVGAQSGNLKIYLKNTTDVTNTLGTAWNVDEFTLVSDIASWSVPIEQGAYTIAFSNGSSFTYNGAGVYVAFEFSNPSGSIGTTALSARCNDILSGGLHSSQSNTALPATLPASGFRPQTQFINNDLVDVARIDKIYTLEKVFNGYSNVPIEVLVTNVSNDVATFDVLVSIADANDATIYHEAYTTVNALAAGESTLVSLVGWHPTVLGDVILTAATSDIAGENWLSNNSLSIPVNVNNNTLSYTYDNANATAFGYNHPNTGLFLAKYTMHGMGKVIGANIVIPDFAANTGNTVYAVVLNSSGFILAQSENYIIQSSDLGATKNFIFSTEPIFQDEDYYVGVAQTAGSSTWRPLGVFSENPRRANTFFTAGINGGIITELEEPFKYKFGIEAIVDGALAIESQPLTNYDLVVYPNPTSGTIFVELSVQETSAYFWGLSDIHGRLIASGSNSLTSGENLFPLNIENLSSGIYFLNSNIDGRTRTTKILKQ